MIVVLTGNARAGTTTTAVLLAEELGGRYVSLPEDLVDLELFAAQMAHHAICIVDARPFNRYFQILFKHPTLAKHRKHLVHLVCSYKAYRRRFPGSAAEYWDSLNVLHFSKPELSIATSRRSASSVVDLIAKHLGYD